MRPNSDSTLSQITPLRNAGFALHFLHPKSKRPIGNDWSEATVASLEQLQATYQVGNNLGVRLGLPSQMVDGLGATVGA